MDTNTIKVSFVILIGGTAGGFAGYFLGNLLVEKLYRRQEEMFNELDGTLEDFAEKELSKESDKEDKKPVDYTKFAKGDLEELVKPYTSTIDEEIMEANKKVAKKNKEKIKKIFLISLDEYNADRSHNKEPISYYENDTTFADVKEDIIDDPVALFGPNIHLHFGEESEDPDIVYVRNDNNGVDYEISRIHNSYSVIVMGIPEEQPKKTKARRRKAAKKVSANDDNEEDDSED